MEAIAVLFVAAIVGIIWLYAAIQKRLIVVTPEVERERLQRKHAWLLERLDAARRGNWDSSMVSPIIEELASTQEEFARMQMGDGGR